MKTKVAFQTEVYACISNKSVQQNDEIQFYIIRCVSNLTANITNMMILTKGGFFLVEYSALQSGEEQPTFRVNVFF
jgi:hypothetical protein